MALNIEPLPSMFMEVLIMSNQCWLIQLEMLLQRFSHLGVSADMASLTLVELWGFYLFLTNLAEALYGR